MLHIGATRYALKRMEAREELGRRSGTIVVVGNVAREVSQRLVGLLLLVLAACERGAPPGDEQRESVSLSVRGQESFFVSELGASTSRAKSGAKKVKIELGSPDDNLPFRPGGEKLASLAWRTWIYTDVGPRRTRLGYLRVGAVLDARGPLIKNEGCQGGWLRINPRGFVCIGKGASQDLNNPLLRQATIRPIRGEGFPYRYAKSRERSPERYFRLPNREQMIEIEGPKVLGRAANYRGRAQAQGLVEELGISDELPSFLESEFTSLIKPYGAASHLRRRVHSGRASSDSGFALLESFFWKGRAFALSSEMDFLALDRLQVVKESRLVGLHFSAETSLPVAFHVKGAITLWERGEGGGFSPAHGQQEKRGFQLTGQSATGGMIETTDGEWLVASTVRVIKEREGYPSVATGRRKWIDISIKHQTLVAYEGRTPVYATLISGGRGGLGDRGDSNPEGSKTVRGTFMIHEKSISSTMDGDEDRADSYELQDVPFVQYFHRGFALHGAYWHDDFGKKRSHGCINLAPRDSAWLFEWSDPQVPQGWHAALNKQRGTVVTIHY